MTFFFLYILFFLFFPYVNVTINVVNFTQKGEKTGHSVFIYFMFKKNTKQVNRIMSQLFAVATLAILILVSFSYLGIFEFGKNYTLIILVAGLIIALSPSILIHYLSDNVMRYYMIILVTVFIGVLGTNNHIGVYITYALVPIYSCLYFEPAFTVKSSILAYISMVISVYLLILPVNTKSSIRDDHVFRLPLHIFWDLQSNMFSFVSSCILL